MRVPRLLLGFAALSLLLHGLLLINGDGAAPLTIQQLGSPYIRAVLSNQPTASDNEQPPDTDRTNERPAAVKPRETGHDTPASNKTETIHRQREITPVHEAIVPSPIVTEIREPLNAADASTETPRQTPANDGQADAAQQASLITESLTKNDTRSATSMDAAAQRNYLLGQLQDQLSRYLSYPLRARRRGWEGEVLLGLRLDGDGQLHDIHLLRSSGYALLDRSAQKALARIERLQLPANAPVLQPINLQLPVVYRLSEG